MRVPTEWKKLEVVTIEVRVQRTATKRNSRMTQSFVCAGAGGGTGRDVAQWSTKRGHRPVHEDVNDAAVIVVTPLGVTL